MKELFFTLDCKNTLNVLWNISSTYVTNTSCVCRYLFFHFVDKWFLQWRRSKWKIDYFDYNELLCCACKITKTQMLGDKYYSSTQFFSRLSFEATLYPIFFFFLLLLSSHYLQNLCYFSVRSFLLISLGMINALVAWECAQTCW